MPPPELAHRGALLRRACRGAALGLVLAHAAAAAPAAPAAPEGADWLRQMHGRPVAMLPPVLGADGKPERFQALVHFHASPDRVFALLSEVERAPEYRDELSSVEPVAFEDSVVVADYHLRILFLKVHYRVRHSFDPEHRVLRWELDPSVPNDLDAFEGSWELEPAPDGGTLARFTTRVRIGASVPAALQDGVTRKRIPQGLEATRHWVDANAPEDRP